MYMARSTMMGALAVMTADRSVLATSGISSTAMVSRLLGRSAYVRCSGAWPGGSRKSMVAVTAVGFGFCSR